MAKKKYCLIIDVTRCDGCGSCILSVKDEYTMNEYPGYAAEQPQENANWLWLKEITQGHDDKIKMDYIPVMFPHNRNQEPIPGVPEGAVYTREEDGITIIDPVKAKGCKAIYDYFEKKWPGTVFWNEERDIPQTYILDAHRLDQGERLPRCAEDCPTQAMHWGDLNDPNSEVSQFIKEHPGEELEDLWPEENGDFIVRYYKLPKPFIAGECVIDGECAEDCKITLLDSEGNKVAETTSDFLGDFQFMYLKLNAKYTVVVEKEGYKTQKIEVELDEAKNLKEVVLEK